MQLDSIHHFLIQIRRVGLSGLLKRNRYFRRILTLRYNAQPKNAISRHSFYAFAVMLWTDTF